METTDPALLVSSIRQRLGAGGPLDERLLGALEELARGFGARTCTFHRADPSAPVLHLVAQIGLPPQIVDVTRRIPFGKGMAGICAERREPVTVCNLQADDSGVVRPRARETQVAGAVVVPVLESGRVVATLGIGKDTGHEYSPEEILRLAACAEALVAALEE